MFDTHLSGLAPMVIAQAGGNGILDWSNAKIGQVGTTFHALAIVLGIGFVIYQGIVSRGALARIIISGLAAAMFIWIVFNVTSLKDRVNNEVNSSGPVQIHTTQAPAPAAVR